MAWAHAFNVPRRGDREDVNQIITPANAGRARLVLLDATDPA